MMRHPEAAARWYYEPRDPEVGIAFGFWVHDDCPVEAEPAERIAEGDRCPSCGAPAPTYDEVEAEPLYDGDLDPSEYPRYYSGDV